MQLSMFLKNVVHKDALGKRFAAMKVSWKVGEVFWKTCVGFMVYSGPFPVLCYMACFSILCGFQTVLWPLVVEEVV